MNVIFTDFPKKLFDHKKVTPLPIIGNRIYCFVAY